MSNQGTVRRAALVRDAVRAARRDGELGELPAGLKIGVRSGVDSIYMVIDGAPASWVAPVEPTEDYPYRTRAGSAEALELARLLGAIAVAQAPDRSTTILLGVAWKTDIHLGRFGGPPVSAASLASANPTGTN